MRILVPCGASTGSAQPLLIMEKRDLLGLKLSLPEHLQNPLAPGGMSTKDMIKLLLKDPVGLLKQIDEIRNKQFEPSHSESTISEIQRLKQLIEDEWEAYYEIYRKIYESVPRPSAQEQKNLEADLQLSRDKTTQLDKELEELEESKKDTTSTVNFEQYPFSRFDLCQCMPQDPVYSSFAQKVVEKAATLYQQKDSNKPFVYGSFACGGLFPDLYILTSLVQLLRSKKVENIHLRVNLIDTDLRDYISQSSQGIGRRNVALPSQKDAVHSHMLFFNPSARMNFSNTDNTTDLIVDFLKWFTQNLNIKLDLYVYGTAQDYVFDNQKGRAPNHDLLVALDYYPGAVGDLAQLALRTIKLGGYLCSLNNKAPEAIVHIAGLVPNSYKAVAELALQEVKGQEAEEEALIERINQGNVDAQEDDQGENTAYIVINKKIANITPETFKALLQRARGDNKKIGRLFDSLLYPQSKTVRYISRKEASNLKFDPADYFEIEYKATQQYKWTPLGGVAVNQEG